MNGFMFSLSFPANVGCVGCGPERRKNLAGKCPPPLIQIRFSDVEFGKISPAGQRKSAVRRVPQLDIVSTFLSLRLAERMRELRTSIGGLSLER
jgi:hypothetical protein